MLEYQKELKPSESKAVSKMITNLDSFDDTFKKLKNSNYFNEISLFELEKGIGVIVNPKPFFKLQ